MNKLLNHSYLEIKLDKPVINNFKLNLKFKASDKINQVSFDNKIYKILHKYKQYIDIYYENWNKVKSYTNLFETLSYSNYTKNNKPLTLYEPISRAYYKLWEILCNTNIINENQNKYIYCGLAEGPGGFVECFINYRKKAFQGKNDEIYCISLKSEKNNQIPDWSKIAKFLKSKQKNKINILTGKDKTGNLYNIDNIKYLRDKFKDNKCDLVTGDGGFDYSIDFNKQEQLSYRLIFCEIVSALSILKNGGNFILKIFEIHTNLTVHFIYLLNIYFETVNIMKPYISRPANSEKYLICKNFKGIDNVELQKLYNIVVQWSTIKNKKHYVNKIFNYKIPKFYKKIISMSNYYHTKKQVKNILNTLILINKNFNKNEKHYLLSKQVIYSLLWCEKFNQSINFKSNFLNIIKNI